MRGIGATRTLHFLGVWQKKTRMRGKAQPDGRPALQIIKTPFLLFSTCGPKYTATPLSD